eukprot:scaffold2512_cov120-Cylindrotheca_fusiformis.AAC.11
MKVRKVESDWTKSIHSKQASVRICVRSIGVGIVVHLKPTNCREWRADDIEKADTNNNTWPADYTLIVVLSPLSLSLLFCSTIMSTRNSKSPAVLSQSPGAKITFKRQKTEHNHRSWLLPSDSGNERTNDEIHSDIPFGPVLKCFIDTPHMQRLRGLKQLGTSEYTYINANHNRFEHSLGVMHLARLLVTQLQRKQPLLGITAKDILCVALAGLLHDIGHGCYSHVYDSVFPTRLEQYLQQHPSLRAHYQQDRPAKWSHEDGSLMMIEDMLAYHGLAMDTHNLDEPLQHTGTTGIDARSLRTFEEEEQGFSRFCSSNNSISSSSSSSTDGSSTTILTTRDWIFIQEAILGEPLEGNGKIFLGRPPEKEFLYDIVNNRHSGLDVDKMDYFARDERRTEKGNGEVDHRLIDEAVVAWGDCPNKSSCKQQCSGRHLMIVWPEKCVGQLANFFHRRFRNHSNIYQHKATQASTYLVSDILVRADPFYRIRTVGKKRDGSPEPEEGLPISRAMLSASHYLRLRDCIIDQIEAAATQDPNLHEAGLLIERLRNRQFYKRVAVHRIHSDNPTHLEMFQKSELEIAQALVDAGGYHRPLQYDGSKDQHVVTLSLEDFIVEKSCLHMGAKEKDPLTLLRVVSKAEQFKTRNEVTNLPQAIPVDVRNHEVYLTKSCMQRSIHIFCRNAQKADLLSHVFEQWCAACEDEGQQQEGAPLMMTEVEEDEPPQDENVHVLLSQVSQEAWSPVRAKSTNLKQQQQQDPSPVPFSQNRHFAFAASNNNPK